MSSAVRLPSELRQFLSLPGPQSLLVRGPPGSGKSTLCLALLEAFGGERLLVTSRVTQHELHREFPWMASTPNTGIQIVDASALEPPYRGGFGAATEATILTEGESSEREALSEFLMLPAPVQEAWSRLPTNQPSAVVIDSWDALVEQYLGMRNRHGADSLDRAEVERMLLRRMGRSPCHLILVLEREEQSQLDYLVNGVVVTRRELTDDRLERWLLIPKLRGIRVASSSYPYTVEGAKFQCIEPVRTPSELPRGTIDPDPDPVPRQLWPGSRSFAANFGRLPLGKISLLEADEDLPDEVLQHLVRPAIGHTIARGGRVLLVPPASLSADDIWAGISEIAPVGPLSQSFRVVDVSRELAPTSAATRPELAGSIVSPTSLVVSASNPLAGDAELTQWLKGDGSAEGAPGLVVVYVSGLESLSAALRVAITPDVAATFIANVQSTLGGANVHMVALARPDTPLAKAVRSLATIRIQVRGRLGRVFLYGAKPWTPGFVLTEASDGGPYDLLRIV
jgi:KaiC/GvpD/RAD55 family RecA-like ATPase